MKRGFTLIELLVVIAIIGILSAVVLASLNSARDKGSDAAAVADFDGVRSQAQIFSNANSNSYLGVCDVNPVNNVKSVYDQLVAARNAIATSGTAALNNVLGTTGAANTVTCHDTADAWATEIPLRLPMGNEGHFYCIDSTGYAGTSTTFSLGANDVSCS
jgi:prepilin-type N-terminal cleavage/methylation domain-containing protein